MAKEITLTDEEKALALNLLDLSEEAADKALDTLAPDRQSLVSDYALSLIMSPSPKAKKKK